MRGHPWWCGDKGRKTRGAGPGERVALITQGGVALGARAVAAHRTSQPQSQPPISTAMKWEPKDNQSVTAQQ